MFWILSKVFWLFMQPIALITLLLLIGFVLSFGWQRFLARIFTTTGLVALVLIGFTDIGSLALQPLEARYQRPTELPDDMAGIIVLGGGTDNKVSKARSAYELGESGDRFVEALRLALAYPSLPILATGGTGSLDADGETDAASVARLFVGFGVNHGRIIYESVSRNTYENAVDSARLLHPEPGQRYALITSAFHMPRAVAVFRAAGFDILPWPVDFHTTGTERFSISLVDPVGNIQATMIALHEWIGLFAYWASGKTTEPQS